MTASSFNAQRRRRLNIGAAVSANCVSGSLICAKKSQKPLYPSRLKELRTKANISQKDLSDELGISLTSCQNYEYGLRDIPGDVIKKCAVLFGVTSDYLLLVEDEEKEKIELTDEEISFISRYRRLESREQGQVMGYMDALLHG